MNGKKLRINETNNEYTMEWQTLFTQNIYTSTTIANLGSYNFNTYNITISPSVYSFWPFSVYAVQRERALDLITTTNQVIDTRDNHYYKGRFMLASTGYSTDIDYYSIT